MSRLNYPPEFESQVREAMDVPEPNADTMDALRAKFVAQGKAALKLGPQPDSAPNSFRPEKESKMKRTTFFSTSPLAWGLLLLVLAGLITLALSSPEVVNALQRLLGYIPGLGVVNPSTSFRVLAAPVWETRDGVTITVEKAIMNEDDILLTYKIEGLTSDKASPLEALNSCSSPTEIRFPDGRSVVASSGFEKTLDGGTTFDTSRSVYGYESNVKFSPIPAGATSATLFIPCISGALLPGILPENWELPLRFVPAPPDVALTMMPVLEAISLTPTAMPVIETTLSAVAELLPVNPLTLTRVIDSGDNSLLYGELYRQSHILFGELNPPAPSQAGEWRIDWISLDLVDHNGQAITWQIPGDIDQPMTTLPHQLTWTIIIPEFAPPLHITQRVRYAISANSQETYSFEFDAGANPQPLQEWNLNQEFQFEGHTIRLTRISVNPVRTGYIFSFETNDSRVNSLSARIDGYPSVEYLVLPTLLPRSNASRWDYYEYYAETLPTGKLKVILSDLYLNGETKDWTIDWQP